MFAPGLFRRIRNLLVGDILARQETLLLLVGRLHAERVKQLSAPLCLHDAEFRVFSQFGDDGIIQYLIGNIETPCRYFVEIGVEDYREANTRFLLCNNNWSGLVVDSNPRHIAAIRADPLYWRHDLVAVPTLVTQENINRVLGRNVPVQDIGLLSIDIDGNDYWIWRAIDAVRPRIVVCEYNSNFGPDRSVTVPYDPEFRRTQAHYSNLYFGASLAALCKLAREKGYDFVGSNSAGNNAYFVRNDVSHFFPILSPSGGYVVSRFRESRDREGRLSFLDPARRIAEIGELPVLDLDLQTIIPVRALVTTVSPDWRVSVETNGLCNQDR